MYRPDKIWLNINWLQIASRRLALLLSTKSGKNAHFRPQKHPKNIVFAFFFIKKCPKTQYFYQKNTLQKIIFTHFSAKLYLW